MRFKIIEHMCPGPSYGLKLNPRNSRGHDLKLIIDLSNNNTFKYAFAQRVCHVWNYLDYDTVHAASIGAFKNKLNKYDFKNFLCF